MPSKITQYGPAVGRRLMVLVSCLGLLLGICVVMGVSVGSSGADLVLALKALVGHSGADAMTMAIVREIRLPRVLLAVTVGATLSLGGLVFQALLRNPLAEPYILGVSGGSAVGAIIGMVLGLGGFMGVAFCAFLGSMATLFFVAAMAAGRLTAGKESILLSGVMVNAFCSAIITFLISVLQTAQVHHILFWLMGDFSMFPVERLPVLLLTLPCFLLIFGLARPLNLLLMGNEAASSLGLDVRQTTFVLLAATSFMVSIAVALSGLVGFVGLVIPHIFRMFIGPDHRLLVPAAILGGGSYLIICDLLARTIPAGGEMPVGIITALVGAPLFIFLLWRAKR